LIVVGGCAYTHILFAIMLPLLNLVFQIAMAIEVSGINRFYAAISLPLALCQSKRKTACLPAYVVRQVTTDILKQHGRML
jgi:hypothetical protein